MRGIVKKFDARGFGIIDSADGSKVPFILPDVINPSRLEPGEKSFSLSVKSKTRRLLRMSP